MRAVIQRVSEASVTVDGNITGSIGNGLLVLLGIEDADNDEDKHGIICVTRIHRYTEACSGGEDYCPNRHGEDEPESQPRDYYDDGPSHNAETKQQQQDQRRVLLCLSEGPTTSWPTGNTQDEQPARPGPYHDRGRADTPEVIHNR